VAVDVPDLDGGEVGPLPAHLPPELAAHDLQLHGLDVGRPSEFDLLAGLLHADHGQLLDQRSHRAVGEVDVLLLRGNLDGEPGIRRSKQIEAVPRLQHAGEEPEIAIEPAHVVLSHREQGPHRLRRQQIAELTEELRLRAPIRRVEDEHFFELIEDDHGVADVVFAPLGVGPAFALGPELDGVLERRARRGLRYRGAREEVRHSAVDVHVDAVAGAWVVHTQAWRGHEPFLREARNHGGLDERGLSGA
jgi:hypothetical protein